MEWVSVGALGWSCWGGVSWDLSAGEYVGCEEGMDGIHIVDLLYTVKLNGLENDMEVFDLLCP